MFPACLRLTPTCTWPMQAVPGGPAAAHEVDGGKLGPATSSRSWLSDDATESCPVDQKEASSGIAIGLAAVGTDSSRRASKSAAHQQLDDAGRQWTCFRPECHRAMPYGNWLLGGLPARPSSFAALRCSGSLHPMHVHAIACNASPASPTHHFVLFTCPCRGHHQGVVVHATLACGLAVLRRHPGWACQCQCERVHGASLGNWLARELPTFSCCWQVQVTVLVGGRVDAAGCPHGAAAHKVMLKKVACSGEQRLEGQHLLFMSPMFSPAAYCSQNDEAKAAVTHQ